MNNIAVLDFSVQKDDLKTPCFSFLRCEKTANCLVGSGLFQAYILLVETELYPLTLPTFWPHFSLPHM